MKEQIKDAIEKLSTEGYVIIEDLIEHNLLDNIRMQMTHATRQMFLNEQWGALGSIKGHIQQNPPREAPYVYRQIISNPTVIEITHALLGDGLFNDFYSMNTNCPGSLEQPLHRDCIPLWPKDTVDHPPVSLVVNIPLVEVTEFNGSMELWPGTHKLTHIGKYPSTEHIDNRRNICPPIRLNIKKGAVLIRDVRVWHRGMPNLSENPRPMIAMVHHIYWFPKSEIITFEKGCENEMKDNKLSHHACFIEMEKIVYKDQTKTYII